MQSLRARLVYRDNDVAVVAVESARLTRRRSGRGGFWYGGLAPHAILICSDDGITAVDASAAPLDYDALCRQVPGLAALACEPRGHADVVPGRRGALHR